MSMKLSGDGADNGSENVPSADKIRVPSVGEPESHGRDWEHDSGHLLDEYFIAAVVSYFRIVPHNVPRRDVVREFMFIDERMDYKLRFRTSIFVGKKDENGDSSTL